MSFDPSYPPDRPPPPGEPPGVPPTGGVYPGSPVPPGYGAPSIDPGAVRSRVQAPAIFLIVIGVLNLLVAAYLGVQAVLIATTPADRLYQSAKEQAEAFGKMLPALKEALNQEMASKTPEGIKRQSLLQDGIGGGVVLVAGLLTLFGGVRMLQLRSYPLCVLASIVAAVPCISPSGCCCLGEVGGIWALIVLMNPDVRSLFR